MILSLRKTIFLMLFLSISQSGIFAQNSERLEIVATDSTDMKQSKTAQGVLVELVNNVHLRQGDVEMFCEHVMWWKDRNEVVIEKNVRIFDRLKKLYADYVFYYTDSRIYKARGHVVLKDTARQIFADEIQYFREKDIIIADGHVVLLDEKNNIEIRSRHAELDNNRDYALITQDPVFVKKDSLDNEEIRITGVKMELFNGGDKAVVTDSVKIAHKEATATCGIAEFYRKENRVLLKKTPIVWQKNDRLSGGEIQLFLRKNNELEKAVISGHGLVASKVDTTGVDKREHRLSGETITMYFQQRELAKVVVENQATSYYYVIEDGEEKGLNKIIGDKIIVSLENRKVSRIKIISSPQLSEGVFYPVRMEPDLTEK
ncbi:MAG: LPS export ABC transporter periplasmic protein LptC [Calditrichaeota bacterium]|nr:LPS export ABC transporter periplasmic protein LptC [Calditrichota bacterium]